MNMTPTDARFNHVVAFEVSKHELVVHILPADVGERITNSAAAVRRLLRREQRRNREQDLGPLLVLCEATGGYERTVLAEAAALQLATHRAHGSRTRMFARFHGKRAKTDTIDAKLLARYGRGTPDLPLHRPPSPELETLRALRSRRDELMQMLRMELNRLEHARDGRIKASLARHCKLLKAEADALQAEIAALIQATPEFKRKASLMRSVKGVGPLTVAACLAYLPELGTLDKAEVAAIAGLAPHANDSGRHSGARHIGGGRKTIRTSLYMAALVARSCNPRLRAFATALKARGKPNKVVLTAIMRKLVVILNAVLKSGQPANT
jgi:transposase